MIKKLSKWQKQKGLSDITLAKVLGYHPSMIHYIRNGKRRMSMDKAKLLPIITDGYITKDDIWKYY